jgi:HlyD family secretion protein
MREKLLHLWREARSLIAAKIPAPDTFDGVLDRIDRPVTLRPPALWSRVLLWSIIGFTVFVLLWAFLARMGEVVFAEGRLEPAGEVREVRAPVAGVVEFSSVAEGESVRRGQPLLRLDRKVTSSQIASLRAICDSLRAENAFFLGQLEGTAAPEETDPALPGEMRALARDRAGLQAETRRLRAQLARSAEGFDLPADQRELFEAAETSLGARMGEASRALEQAQSQLEGSRRQMEKIALLLANNQKVLDSYTVLAKGQVVSEQDRLRYEGEMLRTANEAEKLRSAVSALEVEIHKQCEARANILSDYRKEVLDGLERNRQRLAEIDTRLSKAVIDNKQRLAETEAQMAQIDSSHGYQEVVAPVDGVIFDFRARQSGDVVAAGDVLLKIVPNDALVARVFLPNKDMGFVYEGMPARVRVESFPFREFGDLAGRLVSVGSDALPPSQTVPYYSFPAKVALENPSMSVRGRTVKLQSGMAVTVLLQVRERRIVHILLDRIFQPTERLGEVH